MPVTSIRLFFEVSLPSIGRVFGRKAGWRCYALHMRYAEVMQYNVSCGHGTTGPATFLRNITFNYPPHFLRFSLAFAHKLCVNTGLPSLGNLQAVSLAPPNRRGFFLRQRLSAADP